MLPKNLSFVDVETTGLSPKNCFNYHLKLCLGACSGIEKILKYNLRFDEAFYKTKIKDWPFKGPICIKEKSGQGEVFVIDKWCVLGTLKSKADSIEDISREYLFDADTYKILSRYLNNKTGSSLTYFNLDPYVI